MAITLGALVLPSGLIWSDEHTWSPITQTETWTLTGALLVEEGVKLAGRSITLSGAQDGTNYTAWTALGQSYRGFSSLSALRAALLVADATFTLTLHDARTFTVAPRHGTEGPLSVTPLSIYRGIPPANPASSTIYVINAIRLIEVA